MVLLLRLWPLAFTSQLMISFNFLPSVLPLPRFFFGLPRLTRRHELKLPPEALFGTRVLVGISEDNPHQTPKSPLTSKNMFGTRVLGEFNPCQSPLFPKFECIFVNPQYSTST
jgi:hypothetical protein